MSDVIIGFIRSLVRPFHPTQAIHSYPNFLPLIAAMTGLRLSHIIRMVPPGGIAFSSQTHHTTLLRTNL